MLTKEDIDRLKEKWNHDFMVWIDNERKADSPNIALLDEIFSDTEGTPTSCYRLSQILPAELEERRNALRIIEAKEDGYSISEYIVDYVVGSWSQHIINTGDSPEEIMYAAALVSIPSKRPIHF